MKTYMNIKLRLRQDSGASTPEYTEQQVMNKLVDGTARFDKNWNDTIFIVDTQATNKLMAIVEN